MLPLLLTLPILLAASGSETALFSLARADRAARRDRAPHAAAAAARLAVVERAGRPAGIVSPKDPVEPLVGELQSW